MKRRTIGWQLLCMVLLTPSGLKAEIITDGTVGPATELAGPAFEIGETLGRVVGENLFHSFHSFNLGTGESATFLGPAAIVNVISRVTGGTPSTIDGLLRSQIGNADFYFLNPAGVLFGPGAVLDLPAAFHLSTADYLRLADGSSFSAVDPAASTLSVARPEAFGFLGDAAMVRLDGAQLAVQEGASLSIVGGGIELQGSGLEAPAGSMRILAVGHTQAEVRLSGEPSPPPDAGQITLTDSYITVGGEGGGELLLQAGELTLIDSDLFNANLGGEAADGHTRIEADRVELTGSSVQNTAFGAGDAAPILVSVGDELLLTGNSRLQGATLDAGRAADISVTAGRIELTDSGRIISFTRGAGAGGDVEVETGDLFIGHETASRFTGIATQVASDGAGSAGEVRVRVAKGLTLVDGGEISSMTYGAGHAGDVEVSAAHVSIDGANAGQTTGISSFAQDGSQGDAGDLRVAVSGHLEVVDRGLIASNTFADGDAGAVTVSAGSMLLDRRDADGITGITSRAIAGSGDGGSIEVDVAGELQIVDGAVISGSTFAAGDAGDILVRAGGLLIDRSGSPWTTGITSQANDQSSGAAGGILVEVGGPIEIRGGGKIGSSTFASGDSGAIQITADSLTIDGGGSGHATGIINRADLGSSGSAAGIRVDVTGDMELRDGGIVDSSTFSAGNAGAVTLHAGSLLIDEGHSDWLTGIFSRALEGSSGDAGAIEVVVDGPLLTRAGGLISTSTSAQGDAGRIDVTAASLEIDGEGTEWTNGIVSNAYQGEGRAGEVVVRVAGDATLLGGGAIASNTWADGDAGSVRLEAGSLHIDRRDAPRNTGVTSYTVRGAGDGGDIRVLVSGPVEMINGAIISSGTFAEGAGGSVLVEAGSLYMDRRDGGRTTAITSQSNSEGSGPSGEVRVRVDGLLAIVNGAGISTATYSANDAGRLDVEAGSLLIERRSSNAVTGILTQGYGGGNAGEIAVRVVDGLQILDGGEITSSTSGAGDAGTILLEAGSLRIDMLGGAVATGIFNRAEADSQGNGGAILITVEGLLHLIDGGKITSSTLSSGNAGTVVIKAGQVVIDDIDGDWVTGILSQAVGASGVGGEVGDVTVTADRLELRNGGLISINSFVDPVAGGASTPHAIRIDADRIELTGGSGIAARSTGAVPAAAILLNIGEHLMLLDGSRITTEAGNADGGPIYLLGGPVLLRDSLITTSVSGAQGNGGDIRIEGPALILDNGFVQANTAATGASGGFILVDTPVLLIPGGQPLLVGGDERHGFDPEGSVNVIQAAAPDGVSGEVRLTTPDLDLSSSIVEVEAGFRASIELRADPCTMIAGQRPSSLIWHRSSGPRPDHPVTPSAVTPDGCPPEAL